MDREPAPTLPNPLQISGLKDNIKKRVLHSGSKAHYKGDTRNHGVQDPDVYEVFWPLQIPGHCARLRKIQEEGYGATLAEDLSEASLCGA